MVSIRPIRGPAALLALCLGTGCAGTPPERPLVTSALLAEVAAARTAPPRGSAMTLAEAAAVMRRNNPAIREARAAWTAASAVARVRTPPPNPEISLGPVLLAGAGVVSAPAAGLEAALSWAVPLGRTHVLQDHVNCVLREAAFARAAATERREYLALRHDFAMAALELEREAAWTALTESAESGAAVGRKLVDAGLASAIDVRLLDLGAERARADRQVAQGRAKEKRYALAERIGLAPDGVTAPDAALLPSLETNVPVIEAIHAAVSAQHPDLAVLRADYLVAEKQLRLEAARAIPGFGLGASYERELGVDRVGLPFSLEIPIFDRNQPAIARACARRDEIRAKYVAALHRILGATSTAFVRLETQRRHLAVMNAKVSPASAKTVDAARASLEAGSVDPLRVLEVLRAEREVAIEALAARIAVYEAWAGLEQAAGLPLMHWPTVVASAGADGEGN